MTEPPVDLVSDIGYLNPVFTSCEEGEPLEGAIRWRIFFSNNYGVSVIWWGSSPVSSLYGDSWELAVIGKGADDPYESFILVYDSPITGDVNRYFDSESMLKDIERVSML